MSDLPRAFLTPGELEAIDPDTDMEYDNRAAHISRIRRKIPKMKRDMEELREHRPELADKLEDSICPDAGDGDRLDQLEERLERIEDGLAERMGLDDLDTEGEDS